VGAIGGSVMRLLFAWPPDGISLSLLYGIITAGLLLFLFWDVVLDFFVRLSDLWFDDFE
jgi:hypothetical protein